MGSINSATTSEPLFVGRFSTPLGSLASLVDEKGRLVRLAWDDDLALADLAPEGVRVKTSRGHDSELRRQVREYLKGARKRFEISLAPFGTDFQQRVWSQVFRIPYGQTLTYAELATRAKAPGAVRAAARANAMNPCVLVCPCHRLLGAGGRLTGYGRGVATKAALLAMEDSGLERVRWPRLIEEYADTKATDRLTFAVRKASRARAR